MCKYILEHCVKDVMLTRNQKVVGLCVISVTHISRKENTSFTWVILFTRGIITVMNVGKLFSV